ncbi:MAG: transposase [Anaerolineales bacterium]|jgi:REP element-mobilizing transposase RayT
MSKQIHKEHKVSVLIYHLVCPKEYRRMVIAKELDQELRKICKEIALRGGPSTEDRRANYKP